MSLAPNELSLAETVGVSNEAMRVVDAYRSDAPITRLLGYDDEYDDIEVAGVAFALTGSDPDAHMRLIFDLDASLAPFGYAAFLTERNKLNETERDALHEYVVGVISRSDVLAPLRIRNTEAVNYELTNAAIIEKLADWNSEFGLRVVGADYDWAAVVFASLPQDVKSFASRIYDFCPDVVEQGTAAIYESMDDADLKAAGYALEAGMDPEEGGLALLAQQLAKTKSLHLWWD
jgi:hypothetical protein